MILRVQLVASGEAGALTSRNTRRESCGIDERSKWNRPLTDESPTPRFMYPEFPGCNPEDYVP
jgi:hypothetical protein